MKTFIWPGLKVRLIENEKIKSFSDKTLHKKVNYRTRWRFTSAASYFLLFFFLEKSRIWIKVKGSSKHLLTNWIATTSEFTCATTQDVEVSTLKLISNICLNYYFVHLNYNLKLFVIWSKNYDWLKSKTKKKVNSYFL